jgi:hypothetical protein
MGVHSEFLADSAINGVFAAAAYQYDEEQRCPHYGEFCTTEKYFRFLCTLM